MLLYPLINTSGTERSLRQLRSCSLGVIAALVGKDRDAHTIRWLLGTETSVMPLCLRVMVADTEVAKLLAAYIVQRILEDDLGLEYVSHTAERFYTVAVVLRKVVENFGRPGHHYAKKLFVCVLKCYLRLTEKDRTFQGLGHCLPNQLLDAVCPQVHVEVLSELVQRDDEVRELLTELLG